ncbi:MAG: hypothetical protein J6J36_00735 [Clostridia bacterium]|nr:hypothetical protein [Clostridia bacterium]
MKKLVDKQELIKILDKIVKDFNGVEYQLKESKSTPSYYIRFLYKGRKKTVRISDHRSSKNMPTNVNMSVSKQMERFLVNNIKKMQTSHLYDLFDQVGREI